MKRSALYGLFLAALAWTIPALAQPAVNLPPKTVWGRLNIGTGPGQAIPLPNLAAALAPICNVFTSAISGCVPASGGGTVNFLRADGVWGPSGSISCGQGLLCGPPVKLYGEFWLGDYGAICDNVTNDAVAIANAITAAGAVGGTVRVPASICLSSTTQAISTGITNIQFQGISKSVSGFNFPSSDGFTFTTSNGHIEMRDLKFSCGTTRTCVTIGSTPNAPQQSTLERNIFIGGGTLVNILNVGAMRVENNDFYNCTTSCIQMAAPINPDGGDNWISHNFMLNSGGFASTGTGIHYITGGGWKITNNKINGFAQNIYIHPNMTAGQGMSAIQIQNNSIEGYAANGSGILIQNQGTTGNISNVNITGNEMGGGAGSYAIQLQPDPITWVANLNIVGNIVRGVNQAGCFFIDGANTLNITGNNCTDAGTGSVGITVGANSSGGFISSNAITNYTTKVTNTGSVVTAINNGP